eukprot:scaffold365712_cov64-Attheya_sp.AAC.3
MDSRWNMMCVRVGINRFTKMNTTIGVSFVDSMDHTSVDNLTSVSSKYLEAERTVTHIVWNAEEITSLFSHCRER